MLRRKDDFTYSPGILAKKMGIHSQTLKNHLKKTGLIKQCCGRWVGRFFACDRTRDNTAIKTIMAGGEFLRVLRLNLFRRKLWLFR